MSITVNYSLERLLNDRSERQHILDQLVHIRAAYSIRDCDVLELGCGTGHNLQLFASDNRCVGLEGVPDAVHRGCGDGLDIRERNLDRRLDLPPGSFDWVICLDVLEHLQHPFDLMKDAHRLLRRGGHAIINVPNHFTLAGRIKLLFGSGMDVHRYFPDSHDWDNPHLRFFTRRGILDMMSQAGFDLIEDRSPHTPATPALALTRRLGLAYPLARLWPQLFAGGFFMIFRRRDEE